jgi:putative NADPH-quinone reductase
MRVLVIYANPVRSSFGASLHETVIRKLTAKGHQCDDCDLYAEAFDPVMSEKERSQCTYGADRLSTIVMGDPPRRVVKRLIRSMAVHHVVCEYLACYGMNKSTPERRARFLKSIEASFEAW